MNPAHMHLILNHIPLLTIPMALIFMLYSLYLRDDRFTRFSLMILVLTALTVLPVYFSGDSAEKIVEHLPGVSEELIEAHEEAAEFSLVVTLVTGAIAGAAFIFLRQQKFKSILLTAVVCSCLVAVGSLGYAANLGGKIRHPEISDTLPTPAAD